MKKFLTVDTSLYSKIKMFTNAERVFMVKTCYRGCSLRETRDLFAVQFDNRPIPSKSTISNYVKKFEMTANISVESEDRGG